MPKDFVIKVLFGGLGDHLFMSPLPRIAKETGGYERVFISNLSEYRSPDYRRLVWESNPYVDGFTDEDAPYPKKLLTPKSMNILDEIMLFRGLDDGVRFHEPELYFKPPVIEELRGAVVYDPNYISNAGDLRAEHVESYFAREKIVPDYMLALRNNSLPVAKYGAIFKVESLEHYGSVIASAGKFYCLTSGGATLAPALGGSATVLYGPGIHSMFHHSRRNRYILLNPRPLHIKYAEWALWRWRLAMGKLARLRRGTDQKS